MGTKEYYNSIGIQLYRKGIELLSEKKRPFITRDFTVNIHASRGLYQFDFCSCILPLSKCCYFIKV